MTARSRRSMEITSDEVEALFDKAVAQQSEQQAKLKPAHAIGAGLSAILMIVGLAYLWPVLSGTGELGSVSLGHALVSLPPHVMVGLTAILAMALVFSNRRSRHADEHPVERDPRVRRAVRLARIVIGLSLFWPVAAFTFAMGSISKDQLWLMLPVIALVSMGLMGVTWILTEYVLVEHLRHKGFTLSFGSTLWLKIGKKPTGFLALPKGEQPQLDDRGRARMERALNARPV